MPFAIAREHLNFFHRNRYIEFEDLLTNTEAKILSRALQETVGKRQKISPEMLNKIELPLLYLSGHDNWREHNEIKKIALSTHLAEIASHLTKFLPIRIAFDQFFISSIGSPSIFPNLTSLIQMSSIEGVVCGCLLNLSPSTISSNPETIVVDEDTTALVPLPKKMGSGIFFRPNLPLSLDYLSTVPDVCQLLIVYTKETSLYRHLPTDPNTHSLKKLGYVFGDRLKNTTHPILYKG